MYIETLSGPLAEPVLLSELKAHMRIEHADEDTNLTALMLTAREMLENELDIALISRTVRVSFNLAGAQYKSAWWEGVRDGAITSFAASTTKSFVLPLRPVESLQEARLMQNDESVVPLLLSDFTLTPGINPVVAVSSAGQGKLVPGTRLQFSFDAGFGSNWNDVPIALRQAVIRLTTHLYEHRGDTGQSPLKESGALNLTAPWRRGRL